MAQLQLFDPSAPIPVLEPICGEKKRRRVVINADLDDANLQNLILVLKRQIKRYDQDANVTTENPFSQGPWAKLPFLVIDTETSGLDRRQHRVIEIAWILFDQGKERESWAHLCQIDTPLPKEIVDLTSITDEMLKNEPPFADHIPSLLKAMQNVAFVVAYNANFDRLFIEAEFSRVGHSLPEIPWVDPCVFVREIDKYQKGKRLVDAANRWGVDLDGAHRALADARATGQLLYKLASHLKPESLHDLLKWQETWRDEQDRNYKAYIAKKT